jgi:hypothetical protein
MGSNFDRVRYYQEYFKNLAPSNFNVDRFVDMIIISNIDTKQSYTNTTMNEMELTGPGGIISGAPDPKTVERFKKYGESGKYGSGMMLVKENMGIEKWNECIRILKHVYDECCVELQLNKPTIVLLASDRYCKEHNSFGGYLPSHDKIYLVIKRRNLSDCCRTLYHELYHSYQNLNGLITPDSGKDGDNIENEANSFAGKMMRKLNRNNPHIMFMNFGS